MPGPDRYEVVIVRYGTRTTMRSEVYLNYPIYGESDAPIAMDYFFWVARNSERTILIDSGFSPAGGAARARTFLTDMPTAFAAAGVVDDPALTVVLTHAHYDHAGNLALFPSANVVAARAEIDFWMGPRSSHAQFSHSVETDDLAYLTDARDRDHLTVFDDSFQVAPGIDVMRLGGHTPGQSVVTVQTDEGPVLVASDAIHYYEEYERDMPFAHATDLAGLYDGMERIRAMEASGSARFVLTGHDPTTLERFAPLSGDLVGLAAIIGSAK